MTKTKTKSKAARKAEAALRPTFTAKHMFANITARKARLLVDLVRGQAVNRALVMLDRSPQRAAVLVASVVRSAVANAEQKTGGSLDLNDLVVSTARVDGGPLLGGHMRWRAGAKGRAMPYRKLTSHIHISLSPLADGSASEQASTPAAAGEQEG
jgi:large subunit ribosomal protein L22